MTNRTFAVAVVLAAACLWNTEAEPSHKILRRLIRRAVDPADAMSPVRRMWEPERAVGITRKEWIDCRGMPCGAWNKTKADMHKLFEEIYHTTLPDDQGSFDVMNHEYRGADGTFDGCMWLTEEQIAELMVMIKSQSKRRRKRKLSNFQLKSFGMWPVKEPIRWKFDNEHNYYEKQVIRNAFQSWMDETCVRFEEKGTNDIVIGRHLLLTRRLTGCHSYVGRVKLTPQILNLQETCLSEFGIPVHEIGHTLGLWHEQQRGDRDSTVRILWQNLGYYMGQYGAIDTWNLKVPYDVGSVMHYAPKDGSENGRNVMETLHPLYQRSMGQKVGISFYDALIINKAYCKNTCRGQALAKACERDGYQDPNNCAVCKCPPGFAGDFCEEVGQSKGASCGGMIDVSSSSKLIESPGYAYPGYYNNGQECNWLIKTAPGDHVVLKFTGHFSVYSHNQDQCYHWVEIKYKDGLIGPGPRFCGYSTPQVELTSTGEEMAIVFRSNWTVRWSTARGGFRAEVRTERDLGGVAATTTTTRSHKPQPPTTRPIAEATTTRRQYDSNWVWECDFDSYDGDMTWCDLLQDSRDDFDWKLWKGATPSKYTGPTKAYDGDYYAYIEASNPRRNGDEALLWTPILDRSGLHCVSFYHHMYGFHINTLEVLQGRHRVDSTRVWELNGERGQSWENGQVTVNLSPTDKIGFGAVRGNEYSGDIALDRIMIKPDACRT